ncbi:hypothetical protein L218DRAFT_1073070 [Marasmius fiardii PR-910]|nr:hypothetical protein L218DRAFT_1073070 [Marasmius fiardii PR-910]
MNSPYHPMSSPGSFSEHDHILHPSDQGPDLDDCYSGQEQYGDPADLGRQPHRRGTRGAWSSEEDRLLIQAVQTYGSKWSLVAGIVKTRSSTQCARRWSDTLDPRIDKSPWTQEQDQILLQAVARHGRTWASIAKTYFPGRTGLALKNRYTVIGKPKAGSISPVDPTYGYPEPIRQSPEAQFYTTMDSPYSYPEWSSPGSSGQTMPMPPSRNWPSEAPSVTGFAAMQAPQTYPYDLSQGHSMQYPSASSESYPHRPPDMYSRGY